MSAKPKTEVNKARSNSPQKQGWRLIGSVFGLMLFVGAVVIVSQLIVGWIMIGLLGQETFVKPVPTAVFSALSYILALVLIVFAPPYVSKGWRLLRENKTGKKVRSNKEALKTPSREELGLKGLPTWTDIGLAPAGFIVYLVVAAVLTFLFNFFPWFDASEAQEVGFDAYIAGTDRLVAFLILVVVAPIVEEIIFRGWLYSKLRAKLSEATSKKVAIVLTAFLVSLLFGIVHMQWNVGVNVFAMSLVLCALREFTGTIYAGILLHMIKNGIAFYLLYVMGFS